MNNNLNQNELIESYIRGELSGPDKLSFEDSLSKDPSLQEEFQLQNDLIDTIRETRKAELKARLDSVQVGPFDGVSSTTGFKVLTSLLVATAIGISAYFLLNDSSDAQQESAETATVQVEEPNQDQNELAMTDTSNQSDEATSEADDASESAVEETAPVQESNNNETTESVNTETVQPTEQDEPNTSVIPDDERNSFHYVFREGELILYGDFSSMYEIIEVPGNKDEMFLYYEEKFYVLDTAATQITKLKKLRNKRMIEELKKIKGND